MANTFIGTPPIWQLDTASASPVSTDWIWVETIVFENGTTGAAADECKITDAAGNLIFDEFAPAANSTIVISFPKKSGRIHGVVLSVLTHGRVTLYLQ